MGKKNDKDTLLDRMPVAAQQENDASILKKSQVDSANALKDSQDYTARRLAASHKNHPGRSVEKIHQDAATALKTALDEAACALGSSQSHDAEELKRANKRFNRKMDEKNQIIKWLSGGYTVDDN